MKPFETVKGTAVALMENHIDTDQLIPKKYLSGTGKDGLGKHLFAERSVAADGSPDPHFPLNRPEHKDAVIFIAGENFGCGSSREHAVWALADRGFRVVIAGSFSPIFRMNWMNNGYLPIVLERETRAWMAALTPATTVTVDLANQTVEAENRTIPFEIEAAWKERLLSGRDRIDMTLDYANAIDAYEQQRPIWWEKRTP